MDAEERKQIVAVALNAPNHRDVHILGVYHSPEESRVSLTEMHYYLRPSTGKPYPIDRQTYILDAAKLSALMECVGSFDMNNLCRRWPAARVKTPTHCWSNLTTTRTTSGQPSISTTLSSRNGQTSMYCLSETTGLLTTKAAQPIRNA